MSVLGEKKQGCVIILAFDCAFLFKNQYICQINNYANYEWSDY